jgi:hypothetical protein
MNRTLNLFSLILSLILFFTAASYGQVHKVFKKEKLNTSYPIAGSDLLRDEFVKVAQFLKDNPGYLSKTKLYKPNAWNFQVGMQKSWIALDWTTQTEYSIAATCKGTGEHCYVFVADDVWGTLVDSNAVLAVISSFDNQTPANSNKGIYQTDIDTFGDPPDMDNDPRIIILILDIKDNYTGSGGYLAGYFSGRNELRPSGEAAEIYFMDAYPVNLQTAYGLNIALETTAHEFQHMINWNYHKNTPELTFVNEGLSMVAEIVNGYGASMQNLFANEPNHYLFDWRDINDPLNLNDYARAQRFFLYWLEQFGVSSLKQIVQDNTTYGLTGAQGLIKILSQNYSYSLGKFFLNWEIANGLNNTNVKPEYGYSLKGIPVSVGTIEYNPNLNSTAINVDRLGSDYFTFLNSFNLKSTFSSASNDVIIKAIEIGSTTSRVVDVPLNSTFEDPNYPSVYDTVRFAVIDTSEISDEPYEYTTSGNINSGAIIFSWDKTEPTGYYIWSPNDTICVTFDAVQGGKLDSIEIAMRRAGSITGGVWQYTSDRRASPLGKELAVPVTASISTDAQVVNPNSKYPYNVPFSNWSKIDLRSYNISTDQPFAVGFAVGSDPSTPGIMSTDFASSGPYHSFTYLQTSDNVASPGWYYININDKGDSISLYLIRAYVSVATGINKNDIQLTPGAYSLLQNYPNPFNPSTIISWQLPVRSRVLLKVFDILGREVTTLVNEEKTAGKYNVKFDASNLSSGIYFYQLKAGDFIQTRKMLLLR